jgi:hypothetical protein
MFQFESRIVSGHAAAFRLFLVAMVMVHAPSVLILSAVLITGDVSDAVTVEREPV